MSILFLGAVLGFFFGLTGSGGSTLATPLLVYGARFPPHEAVCVAMIAVGAMAGVRALQGLRSGQVEFRAGWGLGVAGLIGAPPGAWAGRMLSERWLLFLFS